MSNKTLAKMAMLVVSTAISLAVAEFVSRVVAPSGMPQEVDVDGNAVQIAIPDPNLHHRLRANFTSYDPSTGKVKTRTNSAGFRGTRELEAHRSGIVRLLVLGDSTTFGLGVDEDETYGSHLERMLQAHLNRPVEVLNLGVPGYATAQERLLLQRYYRELKPDLVIVGFFARNSFEAPGGNDIVENFYFDSWRQTGHSENNLADLSLPRRTRFWLMMNSNLYRLAEPLFAMPLKYLLKKFSMESPNRNLERAWAVTETELTLLDRDFGAARTKGVLLWIAFPDDVAEKNKDVLERVERLGLQNFDVVDSTEWLPDAARNYFLPHDFHWNRLGHERVARGLFEVISSRLAEGGRAHPDGK